MDRIIRTAELVRKTGMSRVTLWRRVRDKSFPPPLELGPNSRGWKESEITAWMESLPVAPAYQGETQT